MVAPAGAALNQLGFVVADVDDGVRYWVEVVGVAPFFVYREVTLAECLYDGEPVELTLSVAFGQAGGLQIELIQQLSDTPSVYGGSASGEAHHAAIWTRDFDHVVERYRARGLVDRMWGSASGRANERFVYLQPPGRWPLVEVVEVLAPKADVYRGIADAARSYDGTDPVREASLSCG
jgi:Glyoxalase/Bleomycin resistance protein/Dioxygenase superfamily